MKWYKRFSDFSLSREAFTISPLAHLVYNVICDTVARSGEEGELPAVDIDSPSYLARLCNLTLTTPGELDALWTSKEGRRQILTVAVTDAESLLFAVGQCVKVGLLSRLQRETGDAYVVEGFTDDNPIFLNPETRKKRRQRENQEKTGTVPGHTGDSTGQSRARGEERRREEKRKEKKLTGQAQQKKAKARKPQKPAKPAEQVEPGRFQSLLRALESHYSNVRGVPYGFQGGKDGSALKALIGRFNDDLILQAWKRGLVESNPFRNVSTIAELSSRINHLLAPAAVGVKNDPSNISLTGGAGRIETPEEYRRRQAELKRRLTAQGEPGLPELREKWIAKNEALQSAGKLTECDPDFLRIRGIKL